LHKEDHIGLFSIKKSCKKSLTLIFLFFFFCIASLHDAISLEFKVLHDKNFVVPAEETITNELWLAAPSISIDGLAGDDLFLLTWFDTSYQEAETNSGGKIEIGGCCANDLWAMANTIVISGQIAEHARVIGKDVELKGVFGKSVLAISTTLNCNSNAIFNEHVMLFGNYVIATGTFNKNIKIVCQHATLSGRFLGDVDVAAADITIQPSASFRGRILYTSPSEIVLSQEQLSTMPEPPIRRADEQSEKQKKATTAEHHLWRLLMFISSLPCAWLLVKLFHGMADDSIFILRNSFWKSVLTGFIIFAVLPVVIVIGIVSIIGIPIVLIITVALSIMAYAGKFIVAGAAVTAFAQKNKIIRYLSFAVVLLLLYELTMLKIVDVLLPALLMIIGTGTLTLAIFMYKNKGKNDKPDNNVTEEHKEQQNPFS
jgi:hypothetical protein